MATAATAIGTLRLVAPPGSAAGAPALRLRVERELAGADLAPPGLPPAAVLVVRRLVDPLPRRLAGNELRVRPEPAWERAVRERLADAARSAVRPDDRGALPVETGAVLFADPVEALACALRERLRGRLEGCWWWRSVRRRLALPPAIAAGPDPAPLLAARPREAPAALAHLDRWGEMPAVAKALSAAGAARVLAALAAEHGLAPDLVALVAPAAPAPIRRGSAGARSRDAAAGPEVEDAGGPSPADRRSRAAAPPEPWRPWLPATLDPPLPAPEVRCLLGVALGLAAAPHRLRSPDAARGGRRWWRWMSEHGTAPPVDEAPRSLRPRGGAPREPAMAPASSSAAAALDGRSGRAEAGDPPTVDTQAGPFEAGPPGAGRLPKDAPLPESDGDPPAPPALRSAGADTVPAAEAGDPVPAAMPSPTDDRAGLEVEHGPRQHEPPAPTPEPIEAPERNAGDDAEPAEGPGRNLRGRPVETRYGGVLYLIHALTDLDLPEAFERGWRLASDAGPWGTLDLVARGLLGEKFADAADDPLWDALAELADWPDEAPDRRVRPAYRVPTDWPPKLADPLDDTAWSSVRGRLRLWSDRAYLLAEVPRSAAPPSLQARRELARAAAGAKPSRPGRKPVTSAPLAAPPSLPAGCPPRLGAWLAAALPAIRRRLLLALVGGGEALEPVLATAPGSRHDPVARVLAVPGRLHVTSSHVDLLLPMHATDLAVRCAGLDRDPGWLPAFGRVVYFHFEGATS